VALLDEAFAQCDSREVERRLDRAGFNVGVAVRVTDVPDDSQLRAAGILVPLPGAGGRDLTVNSPFWIAEEPKMPPRPAPAVGQDSDEVLRAHGFSAAEIARLRAAGIVG
jgi:crotonobetainyl-CoA:carnitine CoA-transferase CaiB-like acyl-CoA transferase